jgi:hypothetical protein
VRLGAVSAELHHCGVVSMLGAWVEHGQVTVSNRSPATAAVRVLVSWRRGHPGGPAFEDDRLVAGQTDGHPGELSWPVWSDTNVRGPERAIECGDLVEGLDLRVAMGTSGPGDG